MDPPEFDTTQGDRGCGKATGRSSKQEPETSPTALSDVAVQ
jgi:hypothetical protein